MDTVTGHHSLASILVSLTESRENNQELSLTKHVIQQLQGSENEREKAVLAEVLAALLSKYPDNNAESFLHTFVNNLVISRENGHTNLELCARITLSLPNLLKRVIQEAKRSTLALLLSASSAHIASDDAFEVDFRVFLKKFGPLKFDSENNTTPGSYNMLTLYETVIKNLSFLKIILLTMNNTIESTEMVADYFDIFATLLPALIGLRNRTIAESSCHVYRLLLGKLDMFLPKGSSEIIWAGIQLLLEASSQKDLAFSTWLRWVSLSGTNSRPSQIILAEGQYWSLLQSGLSTGFNERRKFCLYILNSSLRLISQPVTIRSLLRYDPASSKDSAAWTKYSTLIEIISLSTSTNQFLAAVPDIHRLLKLPSPIHGSWIVVLMALGLTSSCGPMQKAVWGFLLSLDGEELGRLLEGKKKNFINEVFLPYSIAAHHFSVQKQNDGHCEYGDKLAGFLKKLIIQERDATDLLRFLDARQDTIFAPARVYVLKGIVDGASGTNDLGKEELELVVRIAKMKRFALMKTDLCISMSFVLLLSVDLERVGLKRFVDALAEVFDGKEYLITPVFVKALKEFFNTSKPLEMYPEYGLQELEKLSMEWDNQDSPPRAILATAILLTLVGDRIGRQNTLDIFFKDHLNRRPKKIVWSLEVFLSGKGLAEEWLQDQTSRKILAKNLAKTLKHLSESTLGDGYIAKLANLLHHHEEFRVLDLVGTETARTLFTEAWALLNTLPHSAFFRLETEKRRVELLAVCNAAGSVVGDKSVTAVVKNLSVTFEEVLRLVLSVPLPVFDQNNHENTAKLKNTAKFLYYTYGLLTTFIRQSSSTELDPDFVKTFFDMSRRMLRYVDKKSLLRVLACVRAVFSCSPSAVESYPNLDLFVHELWECAHVTSPIAEESLLEASLVRTLFDISIIRASSRTNKALAKLLPEIGKQIIKVCKGKRSLASAFANTLRQGYLNSPEIFSSCEWVVEIFTDIIDFTPSTEPEFIVETSMARIFDEISSEPNHYNKYYQECEVMAQVYVFDILSRLDPSSPSESVLATHLKDKIYAPWALNKPGMPVYIKWKKTSQLQALLVLERFISAEGSPSFLDTAIQTLCNEPHPRYRFIFEWIIALYIIRSPENRECLWGYLQTPENANPRLQSSMLRVAIMVARELQSDLKEEFYTELLYTVIPLSSSNKVVVRHQATSMVLELWDDLEQWQHLRKNEVFKRFRQSILSSDFFKQVIAAGKMENQRTFNPKLNYTFTGIFSGEYLRGGDKVDIISPGLFVTLEAKGQRFKKSFIPMGNLVELGDNRGTVEYTKSEETLTEVPLQKKSGTWDAKVLIEVNDRRRRKHIPPKNDGLDIIVIASLIENAYNLGGISRVSEIMGVNTLCFHNKGILSLKDFTSVSVNSEVWLPILEVKVTGIPGYIHAKKLEGYSIVGIEQTDSSIILGKEGYRLPKKVVLLLGSEKFGIPAELLAELDLCVEIPQKGETRSMNVQTAAAVVLYEFCRQFY